MSGISKLLNKPILHLNLDAKWFDLIESGVKLEEYREIKPYWTARFDFDEHGSWIKIKNIYLRPKDVIICFSNGYSKNRRQMYVKCTGLNVGDGRPEWGAIPGNLHYILSLGQIIHKENCNTTKSNNEQNMKTTLKISVEQCSDNAEFMNSTVNFKGNALDCAEAIAHGMKNDKNFKTLIDTAVEIFNNLNK